MTTDLYTRLNNADPAKGLPGYEQAEMTELARIISERASDDVSVAKTAPRRRRKQVLIGVPIAAASIAALALTGGLPTTLLGGSVGEVAVGPSDDWIHPSPSDPVFAGLPPAVVAEVLANPTAQSNAQYPVTPETRKKTWQGEVVNFVMCRQVYAVFQEWHATGVAHLSLLQPPVPANPQPSYRQLLSDYRDYRAAIDSGQIEVLVKRMTLDGVCGDWVPAKPGDIAGPTINDVVKATMAKR